MGSGCSRDDVTAYDEPDNIADPTFRREEQHGRVPRGPVVAANRYAADTSTELDEGDGFKPPTSYACEGTQEWK